MTATPHISSSAHGQHAAVKPLEDQLDFWRRSLSGIPEMMHLPTDRPRGATRCYSAERIQLKLSAELKEQLGELAQRQGVTLFMTLLSGWAMLLGRWSGQEDVVIGTRVAGRNRPATEPLIGPFENTVIVRVLLHENPTVEQLLKQVAVTVAQAHARQDVPYEQVIEALKTADDHAPVLQVVMGFAEARAATVSSAELKSSRPALTELPIGNSKTELELALSLSEGAEGLIGTLEYASDLFERGTIERMVASWQVLLEGMVTSTQQRISQLPMLTETERALLLRKFNDTEIAYRQDRLIHELFEEQVARMPEAIAVVYEGQFLTYADLEGRANQLARYLRDKGVGAEQLVGICVERSIEMVVGLLGILKAGGAYVPVDPDYPIERIAYMLKDAGSPVLLTQERLRERLPATAAEVIALDSDWSEIARQSSRRIEVSTVGLRPHHLAYVIYTSGSTGQPKGAMNEHRAVINGLQWMQHKYPLTPSDRLLQKAPFSFDLSVWEFFGTLLSGARLIVASPRGHKDPSYLSKLIEETGVTTAHFVPSMLQIFLDQHVAGQCPGLRHVVCSGEELTPALQNKCLECLPHVRLSNVYGPTEAAVEATFWECQLDAHASRVPIGRPISNIRVYVLDRHREPVPIGVAGEIYIGGVGVGRGYLNRPELTAERFIRDPFSTDSQARLYKTGDLGRWRADGAIEYLGRNDHQVKIRGFRIELGEIQAQLVRHGQISKAVVIAREDVPGEKRLVAYVVPGEFSRAASVEELRAYLKSLLPEYMVPSAFVMLDRLPTTPNGKLDRRALPVPGLEAYASREYERPQGEVETVLAGVWRQMLGVERVGRKDQFFELGGDSMTAMKLVVSVAETFAIQFDTQTVLRNPIFQDMAQAIAALLPSSRPSVTSSQAELEEGVI
jgi:amino acid adenylation domain-containing protein